MRIKTIELSGRALDHAVMLAWGFTYSDGMPAGEWSRDPECAVARWRRSPAGAWGCLRCYAEDPPDLEAMLEAEKLCLSSNYSGPEYEWACFHPTHVSAGGVLYKDYFGRTAKEAASRCFVAARLGEEIDIPDDLVT